MIRMKKGLVVALVFSLVVVSVFCKGGIGNIFAKSLTDDEKAVAKMITGEEQSDSIDDVKVLLSYFGVFTFGDYTVCTADTEGSVAIGGNFVNNAANSYSIGSQARELTFLLNGEIKGHGVSANNKKVATLPACASKIESQTGFYPISENSVIDFPAVKESMITLSSDISKKQTTGATCGAGAIWGGSMPVFQVTYEGTESDIYVQLTDADLDLLKSTSKVNFNVPDGTRVILNYTGTKEVVMPKEAYFREQQIQQDSNEAGSKGNRRVLYNFPNATSVKLDQLNSGTVFAPKAYGSSLDGGGHISGQFIFDEFEPQAQVGARAPFDFTTLEVGSSATATPVVTVKPTVAPTVAPTVKPTVAPTVKPTVKPTVAPTVKPTVAPTVKPTVKPTVAPTVKPTVAPTVKPTVKPTVAPIAKPTLAPTATPENRDSAEPTATPAGVPVPSQTGDDASTGDLVVTVVEEESGKSIPNASVELQDENKNVIQSGQTDEKGTFSVKGLKPGKYTVVVTSVPEGYTKPSDTTVTVVENQVVKEKLTVTSGDEDASDDGDEESDAVGKTKKKTASEQVETSNKTYTESDDVVKTGDDFNLTLLLVLMIGSGCIAGAMLLLKKKFTF